jgi:pSer/pThr/pTyr-binding forkhead associated (FHA) protein
LLTYYDGCLNVEDLDSVNGTFVNGRRVTGKQVVYPGDHLEIGPITFVVEYEMTQSVLDRLRPPSRRQTDEQLDVLPLAADEQMTMAPADDALDALPMLEEDTKLAISQQSETDLPVAEADEADEAIPIAEDLADNADWHLPQNNDLRDLLSGMDDRKPGGRRTDD